MTPSPHGNVPDWTRPRPIDASYWVVPGRLLVGEHPGSRSRAQSMERLRRFLESGVTCFVDLTEPDEMAGYEMLLPFETPAGRRVEYLREPIRDHGVPADRETMARILAMMNGALATGHCVYLHCRAGIGRSAMAAGCWLAERNAAGGEGALVELADYWQQCVQSRTWQHVPETIEQADFVRSWQPLRVAARGAGAGAGTGQGLAGEVALQQRVQGAWYGLALGDALGSAQPTEREQAASSLVWTQPTALALCLAESLAAVGRCDARDQIERYWRWFKEGHCTAMGGAGAATASSDVAKALATYRWRGLPMAGSHDPKDVAGTSLPRVLAAVLHAGPDVPGAIALAAECSRTTHQSPLILDGCRLYAAMLAGALRGQSAQACLDGVPEPVAGCWGTRPLRKDVRSACAAMAPGKSATLPEVLQVLVAARRSVLGARDFEAAIAATRPLADGSTVAALAGTLYGALHGFDALPAAAVSRLAGREQLDGVVNTSMSRQATAPGVRG